MDQRSTPLMADITPPLKWHGGKGPLASAIVAMMPPRCKKPNSPDAADPGWLHYVEPYAGGLSVLLANNPEGISEVVNDVNFSLTNFWCAIQGEKSFADFRRRVEAVPFSQVAYDGCHQPYEPTWDTTGGMCSHAVNFFIHCRQSLAGRMKGFASITRNRTRRGMNEQVSAWLNAVEGLPAVHERLKRVLILNKTALEVIRTEDGPRTLLYLDPPYMHGTRATTKEYGDNEMSDHDHAELLLALDNLQGRFMLSGYHSPLYDNHAKTRGWKLTEFDVANQAAGGKSKRRMIECLWTNF